MFEVNLSDRQHQVLLHVIEGLSSEEIGARMYLSPHTVRVYRAQLLIALQSRNIAQAVHRAHELGILCAAGPHEVQS